MRFLLLILALCFLNTVSAQEEKRTFTYAAGAGLNYFPVIQGGPFGLNVGFFATHNRLITRLGIDGNYYATEHFKKSPRPKYRYYGEALEAGMQWKFLSDSSKWCFDAGIMLYDGIWTVESYEPLADTKNTTKTYGAGPIISLGRKLKGGWSVYTELSATIGESSRRNINNVIVHRKSPDYEFWKFFGITARYTFGSSDKKRE